MIVSETVNRKYMYENKRTNEAVIIHKLGNNRSLTVEIVNLGLITYLPMETTEFINYAKLNNLEFQGEIN